MRIARVIRENENDPLLMTVAETRKTIDLLEQSEEFEKWVIDIRKRYNIPPNGYPLTPQTHKYDIEAVF